jgi:hypothetical protein
MGWMAPLRHLSAKLLSVANQQRTGAVRVMRPRFAEPIRASSPSGLHQQAGHMTASDLRAARTMISCQAGAIHT